MNINNITKDLIPDKKIPKVKPGDIVNVTSESGEGGQQIFEGVVIATSGSGADKTFIVRKVSAGVGVEKTYPLYSPTIKKIQVKKSSKVRRAKLYWLRERSGRGARLAEKDLDPEVVKLMAAEESANRGPAVAGKVEKVEKPEKAKEKPKTEKGEKKLSAPSKDGQAEKSAEAKSGGGEKGEEKPKKPEAKKSSKAKPKKEPKDTKDKS